MAEHQISSTQSSEKELARLRERHEQLELENEHLRDTLLQLERARDAYFELYDLSTVGLLALNQNGVIRKANRAAISLLGSDRRAMSSHHLHSFIYTGDRDRLNRHLLACQHMQSNISEVLVRLVVGGESIPIRLSSRWVHASSGALILATLTDERDNVSAAAEKQRLVEAERSARQESESKDQFIAMLSHELRTPLTPILATCSMLKADPKLDVNLRTAFARITRNAQAEARLIDDLLDATGIVRGKLSIVDLPVDVHELLQDCVETIRHEAEQKNHTIELGLDAANPWVKGDQLRLRQVFNNLLRNAIKFTPKDGSVYVRSWHSDGNLVVEVQDSGIGFSPESTRRIFKPFDQLNEKPNTGGLGLGLAIAKGLVELHRGNIDATSRGPGLGARFVVELPTTVAPKVAPQPSETTLARPVLKSVEQRLLLVEDHLDTAEALSSLLQQHGFDVIVANSVAAALAKDDTNVALVISDLGLPDGTGTELIQRLQSTRRRPAIALSGYGMPDDVQAAKRAGFDLHLTKPITANKLLTAIHSLTSAAE